MKKKRVLLSISMTSLMIACTVYYWVATHDRILIFFVFLPLILIGAVLPLFSVTKNKIEENYFKMTHSPEYFWYPSNIYFKRGKKD